MKRPIWIGGIVAWLMAFATLAQSGFDAAGEAQGKTVLWFHGTQVTALIESDFHIGGSLHINGATVDFTAQGTALGEAIGDSAAATFDVWILIEAVGTADTGDPISIRGGMAGSSEGADLGSSALGSAAGPFFLVVTLGADSYRAVGTADGSAAGAFVVPDDPLTMQMEGIGTYALAGDVFADLQRAPGSEAPSPSAYLLYLPWDPASWPPDMLARLLALLDGTPLAPANPPDATSTDP